MIGLLAIAAAVAAQPATPSGSWRLYGHANESCGNWLEQKDDPAHRIGQIGWAAGFLSGINLSGGGKVTDTDPASLVRYIDQQCEAEPLERAAAVAARFYRQRVAP